MRFIALALLISLCISCKTQAPYTAAMKSDLKERYVLDQKLQQLDPKREPEQTYRDSMSEAMDLACRENLNVVKKYFSDYGFPGLKENGKETALYFWIIVQHGDHDVVFQDKVLKAMKKQLKKGNVIPKYYAFLYDRVKKNEDKPQLYGSQISWDTGSPVPYNLENPTEVNQRRKAMGLETIEEYLKNF